MRQLLADELHAHEEQACVRVVVLRGLLNVAAALEQKTGYGVNNAAAVRAGKSQDISVIHKGGIVAGGTRPRPPNTQCLMRATRKSARMRDQFRIRPRPPSQPRKPTWLTKISTWSTSAVSYTHLTLPT